MNHRFGRLVVISEPIRLSNRLAFKCKCDCGNERVILKSNLIAGRQVSCGCYNSEIRKIRIENSRKSKEEKLITHRKHSLSYTNKNRNKLNIYYKEKYHADPERKRKALLAAKVWRDNNKEHKNSLTRNRRAKLKNSKGSHTKDDIINLCNLQKGLCVYCKITLDKYHVDHIVPLSLGGDNDKYNLQLLCETCNIRKNATDPVKYAQELGWLI